MLSRIFLASAMAMLPIAVTTGQEVTLKSKLAPGIVYQLQETNKATQTLTLGGQELATEAESKTVTKYQFAKSEKEGHTSVVSAVQSMTADLALPGDLKFKFDSKDPDAKLDNENLQIVQDRFKALAALKLTFTVDAMRQVTAVSGVTQEFGLDSDELMIDLQQKLQLVPIKPIKVGDTWEREEKQFLGEGQVFTVKRQYKYAGTEDREGKKLDRIEAKDLSVDYSIKPNSGLPGKVTKSDLKVDKSEHVFWFDRQKGRIVAGEAEVEISGKLALSIMNVDLDGELELKFETQMEEVKPASPAK